MFNVEIISPQGLIFQGQCLMTVVPSLVGDIGVMQGHEAFLAQLREGKILVYNEVNEVVQDISIKTGTAEIHDGERLLVLVD